MATKKMILDLDTGIDDSMAIAYALAAPDVDLIGIIGSYGNVYVKEGVSTHWKFWNYLVPWRSCHLAKVTPYKWPLRPDAGQCSITVKTELAKGITRT